MFPIFIATISGVLVIMSMITNANLAKRVGVFQSTLVNYVVGLSGMTILALFLSNREMLSIEKFAEIPWYAYCGGLLGVAIVASSNVVIPKIPALYTTLLLFIGQIGAGLMIDYLRFGDVSIYKIAGGMLVLIGILYNVFVDRRSEKAKIDALQRNNLKTNKESIKAAL